MSNGYGVAPITLTHPPANLNAWQAAMNHRRSLNDIVAPLANPPTAKLLRGQVGTMMETLPAGHLTPLESTQLVMLHWECEVV